MATLTDPVKVGVKPPAWPGRDDPNLIETEEVCLLFEIVRDSLGRHFGLNITLERDQPASEREARAFYLEAFRPVICGTIPPLKAEDENQRRWIDG